MLILFGSRELLLRLWPSSFRLEPGGEPVWIGTVAWLRIQHLPFLRLPRTMANYDEALTQMRSRIDDAGTETRRRSEQSQAHATLIAKDAGTAR